MTYTINVRGKFQFWGFVISKTRTRSKSLAGAKGGIGLDYTRAQQWVLTGRRDDIL